MRAVAAVPALGLLAGAAVGLARPDVQTSFLVIALIASVAAAVGGWRRSESRPVIAAVLAGFFAGGVLLASNAWHRAWRPPLRLAFDDLARTQRAAAAIQGRRLPEDDEAFAVVEGTVRADAAPLPSGVSLSINVDALVSDGRVPQSGAGMDRATSGGVILTVPGALATERADNWRAGRRVRLPADLRRPSRFLDPGVPDNERALARRGTTLVGTVKSGALVEVLASGDAVAEAMARARAYARRAIAGGVSRWSAQAGAIVAAIVIGDRAGLNQDVQRRLQEAGIYHVIAISGGNIAILAGLLLGTFRVAGRLGRPAMAASIVVLLAYGQFVGGGASVNRATLMAVVYFGARLFDHRGPPLNALFLVAGLLVAADPMSVADPAFLLTFGATFAILVVAPWATTINGRLAGLVQTRSFPLKSENSAVSASSVLIVVAMQQAASMFVASAATEALLFPVGAAVFSRVTFAGLALNFLAIPLMAVAQIAGMAVVPLTLLSARLAAAAGWIAYLGAAGLVWSADLVRFAPALTYRLAPPSWIATSAYYGALLTAWLLRARVARGIGRSGAARVFSRGAAGIAIAAALWILVDPRTLIRHGDGGLHITFLDVGQGDSAFVVFPLGSTMLVDAGGLGSSSAFDIGERVVAPVIRDAGYRRLDRVASSHGDPDHVGGAASIVREFHPFQVWEGIPVPRSAPLTMLRVATESMAARWANVYADDHEMVDGVDIIARHPRPADWERQKVRNDDSLVLELRWRNLSVLLTGDIGVSVERSIIRQLPPAPLRLIKVPHHGSATSSSKELLEALRPQLAVVSVGRSNHFGHPVPAVLERYRSVGAEVFRTDQDGAVTVDSDGRSLAVRGFTGRRVAIR